MFTDTTLYWLMITPVAFFLFCLASFLYSLRYEKPHQRNTSGTPSPDENNLPRELHQALNEIRIRGGHVEVSRLNGKLLLMIEPSETRAGRRGERSSP